MRQPNLTLYGSAQSLDTGRARRFLDSQQIPYEYENTDESPEYRDYIAGLRGGTLVLPTIRVDNANLFNPTDQDVKIAIDRAIATRD
jgi:glutaredoxin